MIALPLVWLLLALLPSDPAISEPTAGVADDPSILVVTAHPDDEAMFAATLWKAVREHGFSADLALITDGAGGYRFSTLAEPLYSIQLTDQSVAQRALPAIRKRELMAGGEIIGLRNYHFFDQPDEGKILDVDSVFTELWDGEAVVTRLASIIEKGEYDIVLTFLPVPSTHAHHKGAAILALCAIATLPETSRPAILGSMIGVDDAGTDFMELEGFPESLIHQGPRLLLDREQPLGLEGRLNYQIVVNWLIAEHKSQGTMQTYMNAGRWERFWFYAANSAEKIDRASVLLQSIGLEVRD